ncbi:MAG: ornithine cyclodeaminase family protein [Rhizobiales bacterium]|nr:ornithine cyclodeaminase family protein [Hyphomicrobiales bacterium]NRB13321.1 ornithine cyclodeaminase family protein [Hyphomicrobiales bacterium]
MLHLDKQQTMSALPWLPLIDGIKEMFKVGCVMPIRHHHNIEITNEPDGTLLLMPAWSVDQYVGVKMVMVIPGNSARGLPAISGSYLLSSAKTGELLAIMDGAELTVRRTAATSALAADFLARKDAKNLLIIGAGKLSLNLIQAHCKVRNIKSVNIWARRLEQAEEIAKQAIALGFNAQAISALKNSVQEADIISCCTLSQQPIVLGEWLKAGTHIDLVGAFKPNMRESDDEAVKISALFVDTREGALAEGGDVLFPIESGLIDKTHILADLKQLCLGQHSGRSNDHQITMFKSVGAALEDLAAAKLAYEL